MWQASKHLRESIRQAIWELEEDGKPHGKVLLILPERIALAHVNQEFFRTPKLNNTAVRILTNRSRFR